MKKLIFILLVFLGVMLGAIIEVQAQNFYEGEYIPGIWMIRKNNHRLIYQSAKFIRRTTDGQFAYCIEPFSFVDTNQNYQETISPATISEETWEKVNLIAYYGYGYANHDANKWYPITQIMIWKAIDPNSDFYFTDSLNGNRIDIFTQEMQEIDTLVNQHKNKPSFDQQTFTTVLNQDLTIEDTNQVLSYYRLDQTDPNIVTNGNSIMIHADKLGNKTLHLTREEILYQTPPILYYSNQSQNLMIVGKPSVGTSSFSIKTVETQLKITKVDKDTKGTINQGQAQLEGAIYALYDQNMNELQKITIEENKEVILSNLNFGTYYIKEIIPGIGYQLNEEVIKLNITEEKPKIEITSENEVIKQKIELYKHYGNRLPEENIAFEIYLTSGKYISTITTDNNGYASITLPYGSYVFKQLNTTAGYQKVDDFTVTIDENSDTSFTYHLDDMEIPVPNTGKNSSSNLVRIYSGTGIIYYETKKYYYTHPNFN